MTVLPHPHKTSRFSGSTLIELATVVGIISLLVGGVLVGKNMVRSSQLQATVANIQKYNDAILQFRTIYFALPGDMPNAVAMWGAAGGASCTDGSGDATSAGSGTETCDGNGDGRIGHTDLASTSACDDGFWETFRAWEHLNNASLLDGSFTGTQGTAGDMHSIPGTNVPESPLFPGGYTVVHCGEVDGTITDNRLFQGLYKHVIIVGGFSLTTNDFTRLPLFTTEEASAVDKKFDDGRPGTGIVRAPQSDDGNATSCTNEANAANGNVADYDFDSTGKRCPLYFTLGF